MSILKSDLANWDGKSSDDIERIYSQHQVAPGFLEDVIALLKHEPEAIGASWLLKHYFEQGGIAEDEACQAICSAAPCLNHWASKLHIMQCLPWLKISLNSRKLIEPLVRQGLMDDNKFVRAWSYNGLNELAVRFPDLKDETQDIFTMALRDEAPSVRARIRNIQKK